MDRKQALSNAMAFCARQEYCESDIRGKLKTWGITETDSDYIIKELIRQKFIDDLRFTMAFVRDKIRFNQWGRIKIRYMLTGRKISGSIINQALDGINEDLYTEILQDLLRKKEQTLVAETDPWILKQKLIRFATSRGFEMDEIIKTLSKSQ